MLEENSIFLVSRHKSPSRSLCTRRDTRARPRTRNPSLVATKPTPCISGFEAALHLLQDRYYSRVDPTIDHAHMASIKDIISRPHDPEIFAECWELNVLYVATNYQRRGLGTLMLQWGLDQAGNEGVPVIVRSSPVRVWLYEKSGFRSIEKQDFDQYFDPGGRGIHTLIWEPLGVEGRL